MKKWLASCLVLAIGVAGFGTAMQETSLPMTAGQLGSTSGAGFWGGVICGVAGMVTVLAGAALITAVGAGTTVGLGTAFAFSAGAHVLAACALIE